MDLDYLNVNKRRGKKDTWPAKKNPAGAGSVDVGDAHRAFKASAHGHEAPPRGRRKFLGK